MERVVDLLNKYNSIAIPISILISVCIALSGVLPSVFVTGANIIVFGPIKGFIISLLGETIGTYITFKLYRLGFKAKIGNIDNKFVNKIINSGGNKAGFLIFQGRLIPFIPSGFITFAAAISKVDISRFVVATSLGKIPSIALEVMVSYGVIDSSNIWLKLVIAVIAVVLVYFTLKRERGNL